MKDDIKYSIEISFDEYVGRKVIEYMREKKISNGALAKLVGISPQMLSFIKKGRRGLRATRLYQIANALGKKPSDFIPPKESN